MNARRTERLHGIAQLFRYPAEDYPDQARQLAERLRQDASPAAGPLGTFAEYAERTPLAELEEAYTRTFDLNPSCAPEIGWHLFGEEYVRGLFMVQMRAQMRQHGLEETGELPDHLVHVVAVLAAMEPAAAGQLARACVCPAVGKMRELLEAQARKQAAEPPFRPLVAGLAELLLDEFELPREALEAHEQARQGLPPGVDLLHTTPCSRCTGAAGALPGRLPVHPARPQEASS